MTLKQTVNTLSNNLDLGVNLYMLQKCPYCGELIFFREPGHAKEDRCDLRKETLPKNE